MGGLDAAKHQPPGVRHVHSHTVFSFSCRHRHPSSERPPVDAAARAGSQHVPAGYVWSGTLDEAAKLGHEDIMRDLLQWRGPGGARAEPTVATVRSALSRGRLSVVRMLLEWEDGHGRRLD